MNEYSKEFTSSIYKIKIRKIQPPGDDDDDEPGEAFVCG